MKSSRSSLFAFVLFTIGSILMPMAARAELRTFVLDTNQSVLTLSGTLGSGAGIALQQQGPGSLAAHYTGTIVADVTGSTVTFVGGSAIAGMNSGTWQPNTNGATGMAPANYGGMATSPPLITSGFAAFRNLLFDVKSGALPISGGNFSGQLMTFSFPSNATSALDYNYAGLIGSGSGHKVLAGNSTNDIITSATIVTQAGNYILTIPANIRSTNTLSAGIDVRSSFNGQLVATAPVPLQVSSFQVSAGQLTFNIATVSNHFYWILGSTNLPAFTTTNDQFLATNSVMTRTLPLPALPKQFFRVRTTN